MGSFFDIKRRFKVMWPILIGLIICLYFGYHVFRGERGIMTWLEVRQELAQKTILAEEIAAKRLYWEQKVKHLSPKSLDLDVLDESARDILNMGREGDYIIVDVKD
ncbi:MAG: septum formation initiator family protein [Alphaproteobacteria bacterium]|nr:septum formation initiator family protein [Alphaproteobacteria bacterium]